MHPLHVYVASSASLRARDADLIAHDERAHAQRYARAARGRQFLDGRILAKLGLHDAFGWPAEDCLCAIGGAPELLSDPDVRVSISHSDAWVACAITRHTPCGIDIQTHVPRSLLAIAETFFAPDEYTRLSVLAEPEQSTLFWRLWTLKEAWCKATGKPLPESLRQVVDQDPGYRTLTFQPAYAVTLSAVAQTESAHVRHWDGQAFTTLSDSGIRLGHLTQSSACN